MANRHTALEFGGRLDGRQLPHDRQGQLGGVGVVEKDAEVARLVGLQADVSPKELLYLLGGSRRVHVGQRVLVDPCRPLHQAVSVDGAALRHHQGRAVAFDQRDLRVVGVSQLLGELPEEDPAIAEHHVLAAEDVSHQARDAAGLNRQRLHALRMPRRNDQARLLAGDADGPDGEDFRHKPGAADVAPRMNRQCPEQRAEAVGLAHHRLAVEAHRDEVVDGLDVVFFEGLPRRAQDVALLRGQPPLLGQRVNLALDLQAQALQLGGRRHERARIAREGCFQGRGVQ